MVAPGSGRWDLARGDGAWLGDGLSSPGGRAGSRGAVPSPGMEPVRASAVTQENPSVRDAGLSDRGADPVLEASCSQLACELHPCVPCKSC